MIQPRNTKTCKFQYNQKHNDKYYQLYEATILIFNISIHKYILT